MSPLLLILILVLLFGGGYGGYRYGGPDNGRFYGGSWIGLFLLVLLILFITGNLGNLHLR